MRIVTSHIYLYINSNLSESEIENQKRSFELAGYNKFNVKIAKSIYDILFQVPPGSIVMINSIQCFTSKKKIMVLLLMLQEKNIILQSISEPWFNIPIHDFVYSASKISQLIVETK